MISWSTSVEIISCTKVFIAPDRSMELERRERIERQMTHLLSFRHRHGNWIFVKSPSFSLSLSLLIRRQPRSFNRAPCLLAQTDSYCFLLICDRSHVRPNSPLDASANRFENVFQFARDSRFRSWSGNVIRAEGNRDEMIGNWCGPSSSKTGPRIVETYNDHSTG